MEISRNPIWPLLIKSLVRVLIGQDNQRIYDTLDWSQACDRIERSDLIYPSYYSTQNFHGIQGGYLTAIAAVTYDAITALATPPNETWIRQQLISCIQDQPKQILDLGCGTGSTTLMLKQTFLTAQVIGLDLSPYMLTMAEHKAYQAGLPIQWRHGLAETTGFEQTSFDLVTLSMILHETPPSISQLILQESFRLLKPGGQLIVLDGNQKTLRHMDWLIALFREPYSKVYAAGNVNDWLKTAQFETVKTRYIGWIHQITQGVKPTVTI